MSVCSGITAAGDRCKAQAMRNSEWCINHHPDRADLRRRRASKGGRRGGRGRTQHETVAINTRLRALEQERKNKETEDLDARIEALESKQPTMHPTKGARRW